MSTLEKALAQNLVNYVVYTIYSRVSETEVEKCAPLRKPLSRELEAVPEQASHALSAETVSQMKALDVGNSFLKLKEWIQDQGPRTNPKRVSTEKYLSVLRDPMSPSPNHVYATEEKMEQYRSLSWTLSFWVKVDTMTTQGQHWQVIARQGNAEVNFGLYNQNSQPQHYKYYLGQQDCGAVTMGKWVHIVLTQSASDLRCSRYVDGVLVQAMAKTPVVWVKGPLVADAQTQNGYLQLADVRFYNCELTQEAIQAIGNSAFPFLKNQAPATSLTSSQNIQLPIDGDIDVAIADLRANYPEEARDLARKLDEHSLVDALAKYFPKYLKEKMDMDFGASAAPADPMDQAARKVSRILDAMDYNLGAFAPKVESVEMLLLQIKAEREELHAAMQVLHESKPETATRMEERLNAQIEKANRSSSAIEKELKAMGSVREGFGNIRQLMSQLARMN